ncbi:hypothetical protein P5X00_39745 (plasmid) [Paraburkholderia sp. A2RO-4L]|uniref:hypothetical protein n=1 Tax=Paraburkholderia sp. A2RO-4L TaxID=3028374 RepID=UPI003DAA0D2D
MGSGITGLKELQKGLNDLARRAQALDGKHSVPISDLLTPSFLSRCSRFLALDDLFAASGFLVNSEEDFAAIPDEQWDAFIRTNTTFSTWEEMLGAAGEAWVQKQLGF